jgi:hypothetical protein
MTRATHGCKAMARRLYDAVIESMAAIAPHCASARKSA